MLQEVKRDLLLPQIRPFLRCYLSLFLSPFN
nr:MAG TPA: hypothetical protein [Caudoviricetes sp.]